MPKIKAVAKEIKEFFLGDKPGFLSVVFPLSLVGLALPWLLRSDWALPLMVALSWMIVVFSACRFFVWLRTVPVLWRDLRHTTRQRSEAELKTATATNLKLLGVALIVWGGFLAHEFLA